jgi:YD repeat-containing protein
MPIRPFAIATHGDAFVTAASVGFVWRGFRTILEEDLLSGLRTTTTFHQKFPLTSQPERVTVNPITRAGEDGAISRETYVWRCDRNDRTNAAACAPTVGTPTRVFPFLDTKDSWTFDATTAAAGGTPAVLGHTQEIAAADAACSGALSTQSGYDAYGNLTARTLVSRDAGVGTEDGTRDRLERQCVSESSSFAPDVASWWLDKLMAKTATTQVRWNAATHALPAGGSHPTRTVSSSYAWNADRTLAQEMVQGGVANQQRITVYTYPSSNNYGLPTGVAVSADGDSHGTRATGTAYSADGYFPQAVANALHHTATTVVRPSDGQPVSVTDANGLRTLYTYDAFGFNTRTRFRGASDSQQLAPDRHSSVQRCDLSFCWRPIEQVQVMTVQDGSPTRVQRLDAQGRVWMEAERQQDGVYTHVMQEYTARGQLRYKTEPFRGGDAIASTVWGHEDVLGRPTWKLAPKGASDGRGDLLTRYAYAGRSTRIEVCGSNEASGSAGCLQLSRTMDSLGRYVETRDAEQGRTRFWYDAHGNVVAIAMPAPAAMYGSQATTHDEFGNILSMADAVVFLQKAVQRSSFRLAVG